MMQVVGAEPNAQIGRDALGVLGRCARLAHARSLVGAAETALADRGEGELVRDERILCYRRRRKKALAGNLVREGVRRCKHACGGERREPQRRMLHDATSLNAWSQCLRKPPARVFATSPDPMTPTFITSPS